MPTMIRQDCQIQQSGNYLDQLPAGIALQTGALSAEDDFNAIRSQLARILSSAGTSKFTDDLSINAQGKRRGLTEVNADLGAVESKLVYKKTDVLTNVTIPAGQNFVILNVGNKEAPTLAAAIGANTLGAVVAQSSTTGAAFAASELSTVAGDNTLSPGNLVNLTLASNGEVVESQGQDVYGLLQVEAGAADGSVFNDTSGGARVKISFVLKNRTTNTFTAAPVSDVAGVVFRYAYNQQTTFLGLSKQAFVAGSRYGDQVGSVDITLARATLNQAGQGIPVLASVLWQVQTGQSFKVQSANGATDYWAINPTSGGTAATLNTSTLAITTGAPSTFSQGVQVSTAGQTVNLGTTQGQIDSPGLTLASTGTNGLKLKAGAQVGITDGYIAGSTWQSGAINVANSASDYNSLRALYGETSLVSAIVKASQHANHTYGSARCIGIIIPKGTVLTGNGANANLNKPLPAYGNVNLPLQNVIVLYNGVELEQGTNASDGDWYPGPNPANGEIVLNFNLYGLSAPGHTDRVSLHAFGAY